MLSYTLAVELFPELTGLFATAFIAATLLPMGSEVVLLGLVAAYPEASLLAWIVATLGNTLGGLTNWLLGRYFLHFQDRRWFPISATRLAQVHRLFTRYGQPTLLFSWLPVVGDGLCLAAGIARLRFINCAVWVILGKGLRYGAIVWGTKLWVLA